jgi:uncharacterized protein (TIGR02145 family)
MNKIKVIFRCLLIASTSAIFSCTSGVKDIDGNIYKTVKIDSQTWFLENLNVSRFRNGDLIPEVKSAEEWVKSGNERKPAWCYIDNNSGNGKKFGKLYNWYAVTDPRLLAPEGSHVATDVEWAKMINYLGGGISAALKIRMTALSEKSSDQNGFSGSPGGCRNHFGGFYGLDSFGYWWSATGNTSVASWMYVLNYVKCDINSFNNYNIYGASVRCLQDQ